jgi:hypothetical protein
MLSLSTLVFPSCPDLLLEEIICEDQILFLTVRSSQRTVACPDCAQVSVKVHSGSVSLSVKALLETSRADPSINLSGQWLPTQISSLTLPSRQMRQSHLLPVVYSLNLRVFPHRNVLN